MWRDIEDAVEWLTPPDVLDIMEAWALLQERWPRQFWLSGRVVDRLATITLPPSVKTMTDGELARLAKACSRLATYIRDPLIRPLVGGDSSRDLVQPVFSLVVAEVAWRLSDLYTRPSWLALTITYIYMHASII